MKTFFNLRRAEDEFSFESEGKGSTMEKNEGKSKPSQDKIYQNENEGLQLDQSKKDDAKLIKKLSNEKSHISGTIKTRKCVQTQLKCELLYHKSEGLRVGLCQQKKEIDFLVQCIDKLQFANSAYQGRPIRSCCFKGEVDKHKLNFRMVHGQNSLAEEKRLLREIKASQKTSIDSSISQESVQYAIPSYHNNRSQADCDRLNIDKEIIISNATVKGKIWNTLGPKKDLQDKVKVMRTHFEEQSAEYVSQSRCHKNDVIRVKKLLEDKENEINALRKQLVDIDQKMETIASKQRLYSE